MELIRKWLSGNKNFIVGAILYKKFGTDEKLKKLFDAKPDAYAVRRLEEELCKLAIGNKATRQRAVTSIADGAEMPESKDPVMKALRNEWILLYKRMCYLQTELDRIEGNSEEAIAKRKPIAFEILELEQECMKVWERRKHYEKEGKLPEVKSVEEFVIPDDPIELGKLIETTKRNIRRNKQLAVSHPDEPQYPLLQKQYEAKYDAIMKKVNDGKQSVGQQK
jgi:hypothetical protein